MAPHPAAYLPVAAEVKLSWICACVQLQVAAATPVYNRTSHRRTWVHRA